MKIKSMKTKEKLIMKRNFKKTFAALIATTTMAVGFSVLSVSAAEITPRYSGPTGYVSFGNGATAGIYRDSSSIFLSTDGGNNSYVSVKLSSASYTTISEKSGTTYDDTDGYVSHSYSGTGITSAKGYHVAGSSSASTSR